MYICSILIDVLSFLSLSSSLQKYIQQRMSATILPISSSLAPLSLQSSVLSRLAQLHKRQTSSSKKTSQRTTFILDDLHHSSLTPYPPREEETEGDDWSNLSPFIYSPLVHLVSHLAEHKTIHDEDRDFTHSLPGLRLVASCSIDGVRDLSLSLLRHLRPVPFISPSSEGLCHIVQSRLVGLVKLFPLENIEKATTLANVSKALLMLVHALNIVHVHCVCK